MDYKSRNRWIRKTDIDGQKEGKQKGKNRWIENQEQMDRKGPKYLYVTIFNKNLNIC